MQIHELSATELLHRLATGQLSSVEIVEALAERRAALEPKLNAFVRVRAEAHDEARQADEARARGESLGPLHGLVVTIKDNVDVAGTDATLGLRALCDQPASDDAVLVDLLRRKGAIILGKTNVPQLLLAQETENALFGVTNNPWNLERVPGGSSGGEACAVAAGMSPLGIGTDIGGSIRIPAHFCGVVGFKPSLDRWSNRGSHTALRGQELVRAQIGCLARRVEDVRLLWRALDPLEQATRDPWVPPVPAGDPTAIDVSQLTIGYLEDDDFLAPVESLRRALRTAKEALEGAGAKLVPHRPVPSDEVIFLWLAAISADGGRTVDARLAGEEASPQLKPSRTMMKVPAVARKLLAAVTERLGERRLSRLLDCLGEKSVDELWALTQRRTELRLAEFDRWRRLGIDALLCPPHVVPALGHRQSGDFTLSLGAEFRWTLLNFPAGIVPATTVTPDDVGHYPPPRDRVERKVVDIDQASVGLPVGVQVVARPYAEEVLLAVMQTLERQLRGADGFPTTPVTPR
ncbi:MAG: amidase [Deltaproteobacteria bacterium]|nr:amidase [Deltaproteobacteria bacterium]